MHSHHLQHLRLAVLAVEMPLRMWVQVERHVARRD